LHFEYGARLQLAELEALHQRLASFGRTLGFANQRDHRVQIVKRLLQALQNVGARFRLFQIEAGAPQHYLAPMLEEDVQGVYQRELARLPVYDCEVDHAERLLHRGQLVEVVQHDVRYRIALQLHDDAHALAIGLVAKVRDALELLVVDQLGDALEQLGLVDLIRNLSYHDGHAFARFPGAVYGSSRAHDDHAPASF